MAILTKFENTGQLTVDDYAAQAVKARAELDGHCEIKPQCFVAWGIPTNLKVEQCGWCVNSNVKHCGRRKAYLATGQFPIWNPPT